RTPGDGEPGWPADGAAGRAGAFGAGPAAGFPHEPRLPYMRLSWMPLATRQPSTAAASSHAAIVPRNGWPGAAVRAMTPAGTDQASTQATVRQGTKLRASGLAWAASATANGNRITE